jgi:hypothetical protein
VMMFHATAACIRSDIVSEEKETSCGEATSSCSGSHDPPLHSLLWQYTFIWASFFFNTPTLLLAPMLHIFSTPLTLSFSYSFLFLLLFFWVSSINFFPNSPSATFIYAFAFYIIILCYFLIMFFMFCFILGSEMQRFY